jgi:hypothetical protein
LSARGVRFRPVYRVDGRFVVAEASRDREFVPRLCHVFACYDVPFEEVSGDVFVSESVAADLETCWNYTTKANDEQWLGSHAPKAG